MQNDDGANASQGLFRRLVHIVHHEITNVPITFIASLIVIVPVLYGALQFSISPTSLELPAPNLPSVTTPIPGLNILLKGCTFLVLQWAVATLFARSVQFLSRRTDDMPIMLSALAALVYAWLSTFISFILWVTATTSFDGAAIALFIVFWVSLFILVLSTPEQGPNETNYPVFVIIFGAVALVIFSFVFGFQSAELLKKPI